MATSNDKYRHFHHALVQAPDYMGIPNEDRSSCREFVDLATKLRPGNPKPFPSVRHGALT